MRELLGTLINTLPSAEADSVRGAEFGEVTPERVNRRNGYRHRDFDTRAGTLDVAIPKLRQGSYFPEWLLERSTTGSDPSGPASSGWCLRRLVRARRQVRRGGPGTNRLTRDW